jgi:hypothetical protein
MLASRWHVQIVVGLEGRQAPLLLTPSFHAPLLDTTISLSMTKIALPGEGTQGIGVGGGEQGDVRSGWHEVSRVYVTAEGGVPFPSSPATVDLPQCDYLTEYHNGGTEQGRIGPNRRRRGRATI